MNMFFVYLLMLMPALMTALLAFGLVFLLGAWIVPHLRELTHLKPVSSERFMNADSLVRNT